MFKVYVGGLYLESPSKDAGAILGADQAKAIRMQFLRDLTKDGKRPGVGESPLRPLLLSPPRSARRRRGGASPVRATTATYRRDSCRLLLTSWR